MKNLETPQNSETGALTKEAYKKARNHDRTPLILPLNEKGQPMSPEEYDRQFREDCEFLLGEHFLTPTLLDARLQELLKLRHELKEIFAPGTDLTVGILPASATGRNLDQAEIEAGLYLQPMEVWKNQQTFCTISLFPGPFASIVPEAIRRACTISVHYANGDQPFVLDQDFARIYNHHIDSCNKWRQYFGLKPLPDLKYFPET